MFYLCNTNNYQDKGMWKEWKTTGYEKTVMIPNSPGEMNASELQQANQN